MPTNTSVTLQYDSTDSRWRVTGSSNSANTLAAGSTGQVQFNGGTNLAADSNLTWDNTNKRLGIGTTSPGYMFHVYDAGSNALIVSESGFGPKAYITGSSAGYMGTLNNYPLYIQTNSSNRITIDTSGYVGIGTTSPSTQFSNYGPGSSGNDASNVGPNVGAIYWSDNVNGPGYVAVLENRRSTTANYNGLLVKNAATDTGSYIAKLESGGTNRMSIRADGNVGIGTTSPSTVLSFGGDAARTVGMERGTVAATAGYGLTLQAGGATSGSTNKNGGDLVLSSGTATGTGSSGITFKTHPAGSTGTTDTTATTAMTIDSTGNVGIGIASPSSGKLQVLTTAASGAAYSIYTNPYTTGTASPTLTGTFSFADSVNTAGSPTLIGSYIAGRNTGSATALTTYGVRANAGNFSTGTVANAYVLYAQARSDNASGSVTNAYGLYIDTSTHTGAITNNYGVYQVETSAKNYFAGNVGIGTTSPGSSLQVNGGAAVGYSTSTAAPTDGLAVSGQVGIGTATPASDVKADINGMVKVAGTGSEPCTAAQVGSIRYNPTGNYFELCSYP